MLRLSQRYLKLLPINVKISDNLHLGKRRLRDYLKKMFSKKLSLTKLSTPPI